MSFDFKYALQIVYFASSAMNSVVVCYVNRSIDIIRILSDCIITVVKFLFNYV